MKKTLLLILVLAGAMITGLQAQDPLKDIRKAARLLGTYNLDPTGSADKLNEALALAEGAIGDPTVSADPTAWQTYGDLYMTVLNNDVIQLLQNPEAKLADPFAAAKAFKGYQQAVATATKPFHTKDALKALSGGLQNIYYMGSILYQMEDYEAAYSAFKATYDGFALLQSNKEPSTFDPAEHEKVLYYSGVCAQQAGMMNEAIAIYKQLVENGSAEAAVYEQLVNVYRDSDPAMAEKYMSAGRARYPDDTGLLYAEINYYLQKGELLGLISKLEHAAELEPDNTSIYVTLGQIYDKLYQDNVADQPEEAEEHFNKALSYYQTALAKDANSFDANYSIGALWYNKAAAYIVQLNELANDISPEGNRKYNAKEEQIKGAFDNALPYLLTSEQLKSDDVNTLLALREIYARQDNFEKVEEYKKKFEALGN